MNSRGPDKPSKENEGIEGDDRSVVNKKIIVSGETFQALNSHLQVNISDTWIGRQLSKYQITDLLGVGGMGMVLKAHNLSIERDIALLSRCFQLNRLDCCKARATNFIAHLQTMHALLMISMLDGASDGLQALKMTMEHNDE